MRKIFKLLMSVVAMAAVVSCTTDATEDLSVKVGGKTQLTLSFDDTRTEIGTKDNGVYPLTWSENDQVSVNGVASDELTVAGGAGTANATFTFGGELKTPYCIAFPAAAEGQVMFAAEQNHTSNTTFDSKAAAMYGYSKNGENIQLKHLTGVLKIGLEGSAKIMTVRISTIDRKPIAGAFDIDFTTGELTPTDASVNVITYNLFDEYGNEGIDLSVCYDTPYIHVAVPAGEYKELYITMVDSEGNAMYKTVKANSNLPLAAGKVREFSNTVGYEAIDSSEVFVISDLSSLVTFKEELEAAQLLVADTTVDDADEQKVAALATLSKNAVVVNDIAVDPAQIKDAGGWNAIEAANYTGTINGNGYEIKGLPGPLFNKTAASFRGLHMNVEFTETATLNTGAFAREVKTITEGVSSVFEDCSVRGTITINNSSAISTGIEANDVGGFTGRAYGVDFKNCVNNAKIDLKKVLKSGVTTNTTFVVGGFVGFVGTAQGQFVSFYNCTNNGDIEWAAVDEAKIAWDIGGFVGVYRGAGSVATFENCCNNGDITLAQTSGRSGNLGGLIGYSNGTSTSPKTFNFKGKTINNGTITMSGKQNANYNRLGGIFGYPTEYVNLIFEDEAVNNGDIVITASTPGLRAGGVLGVPDNGSTATFNSTVTNKGNISVSGTHTDNVYMSGISSYTTLKKCELTFKDDVVNEGAMTFSGTTPDLWIAGLLGLNKEGITIVFEKKATNTETGDIIVSGTVSSELFVGGLFAALSTGHAKEDDSKTVGTYSAIEFKGEAVNDGAISLSGTYKATYAGGIGGIVTKWAKCVTRAAVTNSEKADITFSGTSNGLLYCGGIVGNVTYGTSGYSSFWSAIGKTTANKGDIVFGANSTSVSDRHIGGIIGLGRNAYFNVGGDGLALNEGKLHVTKSAVTNGRFSLGGLIGYYNGNNFRNANGVGAGLNKGNIIFEGTSNGYVVDESATNETRIGGIAGDNYNSTNALSSLINTGNITVIAKLAEGRVLHVGGIQGTMYSSDRTYKNTQVHCDIIACIDNGDGTYSPCPNVGMGTGDVVTTSTSTDETTGETTTTVKTPGFTNVKLGGRIATAVTIGADGKAVGQFTDLTATNVFDYAIGIRENRTEYAGVSFLESKDAIDYGTWGN
uniref:hypothetical protein n=1 Tax=Alistipes sp. TaxID=1872444 RepID=UPI004055BF81